MTNRILKQIYRQIKKYDTIVIARHVGPDPDAIGSSVALKEIILNTFPNKKVYVVGCPVSKFRYLGILDKLTEDMYQNSLLIVTDTPDLKRIDGVDVNRFSYKIKIDHHPYIETYANLEWIDDTSSSASQMIIELSFKTPLKITKEAAEKLYIGLVADTNRFLFYYTTPKTFDLVSKLIKKTKIDFTKLYENLYKRPYCEIKFQGYIAENFKITSNGLAYITVTEDILELYGVDAATSGNMVNEFNYIDGIIVWAIFTVDRNNDNIRGSIRSRGPIINEVASRHGGGGHIYASGVRLNTIHEVDDLVQDLDQVCIEYQKDMS